MAFFKEELTKVKAFVFDIDGVLSAATQVLAPDGETIRTSNLKDGFALVYAIRTGYPVCVITGGKTIEVIKRCEKIGIKDLYAGSLKKLPGLYDFMEKYSLKAEEVMYMGDDLPDYPAMKVAGVPVCPKDAAPEIKAISHYISDKNGGEGCVRDVLEQVLRAQGKWIDCETMNWNLF
ncbi:MAG: HAD hydrolase family protein [Bacteroidia bacterium]|nr:HAD hydrolase family protein [Bacteroidia bacterium]